MVSAYPLPSRSPYHGNSIPEATLTDPCVPVGPSRFNRFTAAEAGTYICTAENPLGVVAASRQLVLKGVPSLRIIQHSPYIVRTGDPIRLDCVSLSGMADSAAAGSQPAKSGSFLRWTKQDQAITTYSSQDIHGPTRSLVIRRVAPSDAGHYICSCCASQEPTNATEEGAAQAQDGVLVEERVLVIGNFFGRRIASVDDEADT